MLDTRFKTLLPSFVAISGARSTSLPGISFSSTRQGIPWDGAHFCKREYRELLEERVEWFYEEHLLNRFSGNAITFEETCFRDTKDLWH